MPLVETVHHLSHSADDMFALVADVEQYPQFVPLCQELDVLTRNERKGREVVEAKMRVGYKAIRETFVTRVVLNPADRRIDVSYIDGPFEYLDNRWTFTPEGERACRIDFYLDYKFRNRALAMMMGSVFDRAFARVVAAFEQRADQVYGAPVS